MRKKDGAVRVGQDFQGLNSLFTLKGSGLVDFLTIVNEMGELTCFIFLNLALGFLRLKLHEADRHLPRSATQKGGHGIISLQIWVITVPFALSNYVRGFIITAKRSSVRNVLDDILVSSRTGAEH